MRISAKAQYACVAMLELVGNDQEPPLVQVKTIADAHGISQRFLVQILLQLKGIGLIDGQEMVKGRFALTRYNLRDRDPALHATDVSIVTGLRDLHATLRKGSVGARAIARRPEPAPTHSNL